MLDLAVGLDSSMSAAISAGRVTETEATAWLEGAKLREVAGEFHATIAKTLLVATTPPSTV